MSDDIVNQLRDRAYGGKVPDSLSERAAAEIERLRSLTRFQDGVIRSGDVACLTQSEREAVRFAATAALPETEKLGGVAGELCRMHAATLRGLLERMA